MKMQILQWKVRNIVGGLLLLFIICYYIFPHQYSHSDNTTLPNVQPHEVWEYVADFSNMIHLNPTIIDFTILSESGNYEHWQYRTQYTENLSHWPYLQNVGIGDFSVHSNWRKKSYFINSTHTTCFMRVFCLHSDSVFQFSVANHTDNNHVISTHCEEIVKYHCPPIFSHMCHREVSFQRTMIMKNLHNHFKHKNS